MMYSQYAGLPDCQAAACFPMHAWALGSVAQLVTPLSITYSLMVALSPLRFLCVVMTDQMFSLNDEMIQVVTSIPYFLFAAEVRVPCACDLLQEQMVSMDEVTVWTATQMVSCSCAVQLHGALAWCRTTCRGALATHF